MRSILALPFNAALTIPVLLLWWFPWRLGFGGGLAAAVVAGAIGACSVALGLTLMVTTLRLFARIGKGTLAPWDPTRHLAVEGPYRYVRNPMISGASFVILGEALVKRFGEEYSEYARHVPRWIPRRTPWTPRA
ncbi:MAG: hypothetical protein KJO40_16230 [Deltaproteobacteria bacterium]|nr:hypothetical protein [Deltaproteobacteria bacterium]MBT8465586.1 hypothetical protein [Deltaproteobacteria bacterium]NNK07689.1 hypothetical protein [Myxococcales bacterium]NNK42160.1 hypothetical protein [Myxococcales bacterium]